MLLPSSFLLVALVILLLHDTTSNIYYEGITGQHSAPRRSIRLPPTSFIHSSRKDNVYDLGNLREWEYYLIVSDDFCASDIGPNPVWVVHNLNKLKPRTNETQSSCRILPLSLNDGELRSPLLHGDQTLPNEYKTECEYGKSSQQGRPACASLSQYFSHDIKLV